MYTCEQASVPDFIEFMATLPSGFPDDVELAKPWIS